MNECIGCASATDKCRLDGCPDCCRCGRQLRPDRWLAMTRWRAQYGLQDARFLADLFDEYDRDHDCMDNIRVTRVSPPHERDADLICDTDDEYEDARERGCCGSVDTEVRAPSGVMYRVGFNYGH